MGELGLPNLMNTNIVHVKFMFGHYVQYLRQRCHCFMILVMFLSRNEDYHCIFSL